MMMDGKRTLGAFICTFRMAFRMNLFRIELHTQTFTWDLNTSIPHSTVVYMTKGFIRNRTLGMRKVGLLQVGGGRGGAGAGQRAVHSEWSVYMTNVSRLKRHKPPLQTRMKIHSGQTGMAIPKRLYEHFYSE